MEESELGGPFPIMNEADLRRKIQGMSNRTVLYKILKSELTKRGYWRSRRGRYKR